MNHHDNSNSYSRPIHHPVYQQTYGQYPMSQMMPAPQMSQMSQDYNDYSFKYKTIDPSQMISANQMNSFSFKNMHMNQSNIIPANQMSRMSNVSQYSQNTEDFDIDTIISPIVLKAYTVLRESQLKPNLLDKIEQSLRQKLQLLKKQRKNFKDKMDELIQIAEKKERMADQLLRKKKNRNLSPMNNKQTEQPVICFKKSANDKIRSKTLEYDQHSQQVTPSKRNNRFAK